MRRKLISLTSIAAIYKWIGILLLGTLVGIGSLGLFVITIAQLLLLFSDDSRLNKADFSNKLLILAAPIIPYFYFLVGSLLLSTGLLLISELLSYLLRVENELRMIRFALQGQEGTGFGSSTSFMTTANADDQNSMPLEQSSEIVSLETASPTTKKRSTDLYSETEKKPGSFDVEVTPRTSETRTTRSQPPISESELPVFDPTVLDPELQDGSEDPPSIDTRPIVFVQVATPVFDIKLRRRGRSSSVRNAPSHFGWVYRDV